MSEQLTIEGLGVLPDHQKSAVLEGKFDKFRLCVVETPYRASSIDQLQANVYFAGAVCRSLIYEGYNPFASHLFYTNFLNDRHLFERTAGIHLGYEWAKHAEVAFFCLRPDEEWGKSGGMVRALEHWKSLEMPTVLRRYTLAGELLSQEDL